MVTGNKVQEVGFCFKDKTHRVGFSADGLISAKHGVEIKSPYSSKNYIEFLVSEKVKAEWMNQVQFSMWASGLEKWDLVQYDPRMKKKMVHYITIDRDEAMMKKFDEAVPKFIKDMDKMLDACGFTFGDQWKRKDIFIEESAS